MHLAYTAEKYSNWKELPSEPQCQLLGMLGDAYVIFFKIKILLVFANLASGKIVITELYFAN
jgi:hypothetical protein